MSDRFYTQQMQYLNIKSVFELGQYHRGEIKKTGKRSHNTIAPKKEKALSKADIILKINNYFTDPIQGLSATTLKGLTQILCHIESAIEAYSEILPITPYFIEDKTPKKDLIEEIQELLGIRQDLEINGLTIKTLTHLAINISKGISI